MQNPNCNGGACRSSRGEVRRLEGAGGSADILCHDCFIDAIKWREERNKRLEAFARFDLPLWSELDVYGAD